MATISRRRFLAGAGLTVLGSLLMSCGTNGGTSNGATAGPSNGTSSGVALAVARSDKPRQADPLPAPADIQVFAAGHNAFGLDLYGQLRTGSGNLFFSPYSIAQVLTMTSAGARGQTAQQMATTLHSAFPQAQLHPAANALDQALTRRGAEQDGFKLEIVNSIWGQSGHSFLPEFLDVLAANYGAGLQLLDFKGAPEAARTTINDTIAQQTHDKIKDLLPPGSINDLTRLVLANAIYFNAKWIAPFAKEATHDGPFNLADGSTVTVSMMWRHAVYPYTAGQGYQAIALPYRGGVSMLLMLPDAGQLAAFEAGLDSTRLQAILDGLRPRDIALTMPKFEYHSDSISLRDRLAALGMAEAFDPQAADFSGMDGKRDLHISDAIHKAMVRVDEDGTEAAAATAVTMETTSARVDPPLELKVDRPFVFVIRDDTTGALLFMGRIANPKAA